MSQEYLKYLAANVLSEGNIVTYRSLGRALKVHSNVAKRMLYDFHHRENSKKTGSVHATYLVAGTQVVTESPPANGVKDEEEDRGTYMQSSPYMSSPTQAQEEEEEPKRQGVVTLVREEQLEELEAKYEEISSIHVYSLQPSSIQNLEILSNTTQQIMIDYAKEDPLTHNKVYGIIQNPNVKRRTGARPPVPVAAAQTQAKAAAKVPAKAPTEPAKATQPKVDVKKERGREQKKPTSKVSGIKRQSSDLFKSFAKTQPKQERKSTASAAATPAPSQSQKSSAQEDVVMDDDDDDDYEEDEAIFEPKQTSNTKSNARAEQQEKLRKMMEDDDEPMESAPETGGEEQKEDAEEDDEEESAPIDAPIEEPEGEKPSLTVSGGRRRGRRKVMKKNTTEDDEGYLVTKEEAVWESFSEDEPVPSSKPKLLAPAAAKGGKKATGAKPGQGSIMSFFGKK